MLAVLTVVAPVFGVILLGYLSVVFRLLPESSGKGLSDFVFSVSMPALLFHTMATMADAGVAPLGLILGYFGTSFLVWGLASLATTRLLARPATDAPSISMASCFGNTVMLGLPLGTAYFGAAAAPAIAVIVAAHAPTLWVIATLQQEWLERDGSSERTHSRLAGVAVDLITNPIVFSVVAGALWHLLGLGLWSIPDRLLSLLGEGAVPGSLFALGMGLTRFEARSDTPALALITTLKLAVFPVLAWLASRYLLGLSPIGVDAVTLLAACPTGANAFLFASRFEKATGPVSGAIAVGTTLAAVTISAVLLILGRPG